MTSVVGEGSPPRTIVYLGPFGLAPKATMLARAVPAARAMAARGHRVTVIMPPWHTPEAPARIWREAGVELEYVSLRGLRFPAAGHLTVTARMVRAARRRRPDIVHAFKPKAYSGLAAAWLSFGGGAPVLIDTDDWEGPGGWNEIGGYSRTLRLFFGAQERYGLRRAQSVTVASRALETLVWSLGVDPSSTLYLPNAVDDARAQALAAVPRELGARSLLLYTRFFEFDLRRPLEVLALARREVPTLRLEVAGEGLAGEEEDFRRLAVEMGLGDAVRLHGWVDEATRHRLFAEVAAALYPFDDTLINRTKSSVKLLELMAAGVPVIGENVGEIPRVIESGISGLVTPQGNAAAMAAAAVKLVTDGPFQAAMADGARRRIRDAFTWGVRAAPLEVLYEAVLRGTVHRSGLHRDA